MIKPGYMLHGRYLIMERVGKGGFGVVYRAEDKLTDQVVAIKFIQKGDGDSAHHVLSLMDEARQLARSAHPNIVRVENFGETEDEAYMVMPFADGGTLHLKLNKWKQLPYGVAGRFLQQISAGLDYAHSKGILHRDLKPLNILLFKPKEESSEPEQFWQWEAQISDFGLAKAISEASQYTSTRMNGTPAYMAPEQFDGRVGRRSDIYALGITLYQMLAGELPFKGTQFELMRAHFNKSLPRLADKRPDVPPGLQELLEEATAKAAEERIVTAGELFRRYSEIIAEYGEDQDTEFMSGGGMSTDLYSASRLHNAPIPLLYNPASADELQPAAIQKLLTSFNEAKRAKNLPNILQFSADGNYMAVAYSDLFLEVGQVKGWRNLQPEIKRLGMVEAEENFESLITSAVFEPDNKSVITGEFSGQILTWNLITGVPQIIGNHTATVSGLLLLPDGAVASASYDGTLRRWRSSPDSRTSTDFPILERDAWATGLAGLPRPGDNYWLVTAWDDGALVLCDQEGYDVRNLLEGLPLNVLASSPEGRWLAAIGQDGQLWLWRNNLSEPAPVPVSAEAPQQAIEVTALSFSMEARWLAAGDSRGGLQVLDLQNPTLGWSYTRLPQEDQTAVRCLSWVDPNRTLVAYMDGKLALEETAGLLTPLAYFT